jgi:hypothetical protein
VPEPEPFGTPQPYGRVVGRNISAARGRLQLTQTAVATRMRALGFDWHQQTVANVEKGKRRVAVEEVFALSYALATSIAALTATTPDDFLVSFPSGETVFATSVFRSARGFNDGSVRWEDDDSPVFGEPSKPQMTLPDGGVWPEEPGLRAV